MAGDVYDDEVIRYVWLYSKLSRQLSTELQVSQSAILGSILDEVYDTKSSSYAQFTRYIGGDVNTYWRLTSHDSIAEQYAELKTWTPEQRYNASDLDKVLNPLLAGQGPGWIKLYTAIELLETYNIQYLDSDPLGLKKYNNDYVSLERHLTNVHGDATVKFASLMVKEAYDWGAQYAGNWNNLTVLEKEAFAVHYYNVGRERMQDAFSQAVATGGTYDVDIDGSDVAQRYLNNRASILQNSDEDIISLSGLRDLIAEGELNDKIMPYNRECFGAGTHVSTLDGSNEPIEALGVGDSVLAFDYSGNSGQQKLKVCSVTAIHTREVEETLDFHGTIVTPGHVFLTGDGTFKKLADILEEDGTVVREDGTVVRARTNCPVGSEDDRAVPLRYTDPETGKAETVSIRAGAPFAADGDKVVTVAEAMRKIGCELGTDGLFVDLDGNKVPAQWPWGKPEPTNLAENRVSFV